MSYYSFKIYLEIDPVTTSFENFSKFIPLSRNIILDYDGLYVHFTHDINGHIYPIHGSLSLLNTQVMLRDFKLEEFHHLSQSASKLSFDIDGSFLDAVKKFSASFTLVPYIDYGKIITDLEKKKFLIVYKSQNILASDKRKFIMRDDPDEYEVDCLGTKMHSELTSKVLNLWSSTIEGK